MHEGIQTARGHTDGHLGDEPQEAGAMAGATLGWFLR